MRVNGTPYSQPHVMIFDGSGGCVSSHVWPVSTVNSLQHAFMHGLSVAPGSVVIHGSLPPGEYIDFGAGPLHGPGMFLVRFDESMNLIYSNKYDAVGMIAARNDGHVMMAHSFTGTVDLGTGPITSPGTTTSMLLAELNEDGKTHDAMALWANNSQQFPTGLDVYDPDSLFAGRIMLSGRYYTSSSFNWDLFAGFSSK